MPLPVAAALISDSKSVVPPDVAPEAAETQGYVSKVMANAASYRGATP